MHTLPLLTQTFFRTDFRLVVVFVAGTRLGKHSDDDASCRPPRVATGWSVCKCKWNSAFLREIPAGGAKLRAGRKNDDGKRENAGRKNCVRVGAYGANRGPARHEHILPHFALWKFGPRFDSHSPTTPPIMATISHHSRAGTHALHGPHRAGSCQGTIFLFCSSLVA